jgi:hypothetical protein
MEGGAIEALDVTVLPGRATGGRLPLVRKDLVAHRQYPRRQGHVRDQRRQRNRTRGRFRVEPSIGPVGLGAPRPASGSAGSGEGLRRRVRVPLLVGEGADEPEPTVPAAFRPKAVISFGGECGPTQRTASNRLAAQFQAVRIRSRRKPRPKMSSPAKMRHTGRRRSGRPKRDGQGLGPRRAGQR